MAQDFNSQIEYVDYSKEVHEYSEGIPRLLDLAKNYVYDAERAFQNGKKVVWGGASWDSPFIYACDYIPVAYTELGRLGSRDAIRIAENQFQLPYETCSMVKATIGEFYLRKGGINRVLFHSSGCEPYNIAGEILKGIGFDSHNIDTTYRSSHCNQSEYEDLVNFLIGQIQIAARWLTGTEIDEEKLKIEIKRRNQTMRKIRKIIELRQKAPFYIRSLPTMYLLMGSSHYFGKPDEYMNVLDTVLAELEREAKKTNTEKFVPLVWAGSRSQDFGMYQTIDDSGGAVLAWITAPAFNRDYDEQLPPLESLARYLLSSQFAGSVRFRQEEIERQIKQTNARGIIFHHYMGCSFAGLEQEMLRDYFKKQGIPGLSLEGIFQVGSPPGQVLTRVKALIEMLV